MTHAPRPDDSRAARLREVGLLFFALGCVAFGGPAAHLALLEEWFVVRRRWLTRAHFLDLMGATNLIPGPNSTEMVMHLAYERAGWAGLVVGGVAFIAPAAALATGLAALYVRYGALPSVQPALAGLKPAVVAVVAHALLRLAPTAVRGWATGACVAASAALVLLGGSEIAALPAVGAAGAVVLYAQRRPGAPLACAGVLALPAAGAAADLPTLGALALFFLKVGSVLYGSGYVLVAFMEGGLVEQHGWLTRPELLDAVAAGQFTPGPVSTAVTFAGYLMAGVPGALVSTAAFFLPSFFFVGLLNPLVHRLRRRTWAGCFLDAVAAASLGLMAAVLVDLGAAALRTGAAWAIGAATLLLAARCKTSAAWLIPGSALAGWLLHAAGFALG